MNTYEKAVIDCGNRHHIFRMQFLSDEHPFQFSGQKE